MWGPYQLPQKRPQALVSILRSLAAAEIANMRHLRDFRSPAIFEFFNTIRTKADVRHALVKQMWEVIAQKPEAGAQNYSSCLGT
jgi:hypothetical protein